MKRKKKFIRHVHCEADPHQLFEVFIELGFTIYEDPSQDGDDYIISNRKLTYADFIELYVKSFGSNKSRQEAREWATEAFSDMSQQELDQVTV